LDPNSAQDHYVKGRSNYILHLGTASITILWLLVSKNSSPVTSVRFYNTSKLLCFSAKNVQFCAVM